MQKYEESEGKSLPLNVKEFYSRNNVSSQNDKKDKKKEKKKKLTEKEIFLKERENLSPENCFQLQQLLELIK